MLALLLGRNYAGLLELCQKLCQPIIAREKLVLFTCVVYTNRVYLLRIEITKTHLSNHINHKNYNFLACDCFKNVLFSTNSLAKLLSDSLLLDSLLLDSLLSDSLISQSHSKMLFKSTNHIQSCKYVCGHALLLLCFCP